MADESLRTDLPEASTSDKVRFGVKWVSASTVVARGVSFLTTAVLARLLVPEMFGLVAIASVAIGILGVLREAGIGSAFIQREEAGPADTAIAANTAFFIILALNSALFVVAWSLAPTMAGFFESADNAVLIPILRAMCLSFLIEGAMATPNMLMQRNLDFGKHAMGPIVASLVNAVVAPAFAFAGYGAWSLVFGHLSSLSAWALLAIHLSGWRPRRQFSGTIARQLLGYGKYLWAFGALSAIGDSLDRVLIGRWLGPASVGVYGLGLALSNLPATQIGRLVGAISFPWFSRIKSEPGALQSAFLRTLSYVSILTMPLAFGTLAVSRDLVLTVYGSRWVEATPVIEVLAFYGLGLSVSSATGGVFKAIGRPQILLYTSILHQTIQISLLLTFGRYGLVAVAYSMLVPMLLSTTIAFLLVAPALKLHIRQVLTPLVRSGLPALGMFATVRRFDGWLDTAFAPAVPVSLLCSVAVGGAVYLLLTSIMNRTVLLQFSATVRSVALSKGKLV